MPTKERLDLIILQRGLADSREKARAIIMAGQVYVSGQKEDKPGTFCHLEAQIEIKEKLPYVSRGGLKLAKALKVFGIDLHQKTAIDVGASTGGFTDCMLQNGAAKVYAVDVGYGQLAWSLRNDSRVINKERTNIRYIQKEQIPEQIDFFSVDVSFISLKLVLPAVKNLISSNAQGVCLIKPQFEAGRDSVGKKGVVKDPKVHKSVIQEIYDFACLQEFYVKGLDFSPIKGPEGNIEYLIYICSEAIKDEDTLISIEDLVEKAHLETRNTFN